MGEATEWALAMAHAVRELREKSGLTVQELAARIDRDPSYLYARLKGRAPFNVNDWDLLARAFGIHPLEIARIASRHAASASIYLEPTVETEPTELACRLRRLVTAPRATGSDFSVASMLLMAEEREIELSSEQWDSLRDGSFGGDVPLRILELVSEYAGVPLGYLADLTDGVLRENTEAHLELRAAIREVGAEAVLARSVEDAGPEALRAIATSLRLISKR
jgi:transcriptional regulator with XRE-family HTH domain